MKYKEAMRQYKGGMPVDHPSRKSGICYASVFNQKGKILTSFRVVNLIASSDKGTEDTPHASFLLRIKIFHKHISFSSWHTTSESVAELQQKTQSTGLWDKSLAQTGRYLLLQETLPYMLWTFLIRAANIRQNKRYCYF